MIPSQAMTTQATTAPPLRAVRDALPAGLAGLVAPHLAAAAWAPALLLFIRSSAPAFRFGARG